MSIIGLYATWLAIVGVLTVIALVGQQSYRNARDNHVSGAEIIRMVEEGE